MGWPLTLISPRPCLAKAQAVAVFFLWRDDSKIVQWVNVNHRKTRYRNVSFLSVYPSFEVKSRKSNSCSKGIWGILSWRSKKECTRIWCYMMFINYFPLIPQMYSMNYLCIKIHAIVGFVWTWQRAFDQTTQNGNSPRYAYFDHSIARDSEPLYLPPIHFILCCVLCYKDLLSEYLNRLGCGHVDWMLLMKERTPFS